MYNKLFSKILDSSIWLQPTPTRIVWLTFIAVMDEDGFVQFASVANVAHRAVVTLQEAEDAIRCLESPDPDSSDPDFDGRRVERVPGGWLVLNAEKHRDMVTRAVVKEQTRERVRKHRSKQTVRPGCNAPVTPCNAPGGSVTQSDTDTEADSEDVQACAASALAVRQTGRKHVPTDGPLEAVHPIKALLTEHDRLFRLHVGQVPHYTGKDAKLAGQLIAQHGYDAVVTMLPRLFDSMDPFVRQSGKDMAILSSCWNKLIVQAQPTAQLSETTTKTLTAGARWLAKQQKEASREADDDA